TGLEAAFGLDPLEDAVQRAAYAALAIQRARARGGGSALTPTARIGLHADSYLVGHMGRATQIDREGKRAAALALGPLTAVAAPDEMVVSRAMPSRLRRHFAFEGPIGADAAYRLLGRADRPAVFDGPASSLIGREPEMAVLEARWTLARQALGQIVGVV